MGTVLMCRAAWPVLKAKAYGRIVNTTSSAMAGFASMSAYGASKGGVFSLSRALAVEGMAFGIKVNMLSPGAFTRMVPAAQDELSPVMQRLRPNLPAELASPVMGLLAHESCPATGACIDAAGGRVQATYLAQTAGFTDADLTIEAVAGSWAEVMPLSTDTIAIGATNTSKWGFKPYRLPTT